MLGGVYRGLLWPGTLLGGATSSTQRQLKKEFNGLCRLVPGW
jgi:hypothetical protein